MSSSTSRAVLRCVAARVVRGPAPEAPGASKPPGHDDASIGPSTAPYRAAARLLRGSFASDPVRLQRSLLELARREDARRDAASRRADPVVSALHGMVNGEAAERFAELVRQHLGGPVLCYEDRQSLLRAAARLGIGRFDANLIIAAMQHRAEGKHIPVRSATVGGSRLDAKWWPAVTVALAVEATLSVLAWWALRR
jgi:hypothetical protein